MAERLADVKMRFEAEGVSAREWAIANGFNPRTVYAVLNGTLKCRRGVSHRIAVALGIKSEPASKILVNTLAHLKV